MKIRFEGTPLCSEQLTGIGIHEKELCKAMISQFSEDEYEFTYFTGVRNVGRKKQIMVNHLWL